MKTTHVSFAALLLLAAAGVAGAACGEKAPAPASPATVASSTGPVAPPTPALHLPPPPYGTKEALARMIDAHAAGYGSAWGPGFAPSGYVLVARGGETVYGHAFGVANPKTGARADENTRFRIGSLTKQFTAVAALKLASEKKLSLEDPVKKWVPALPAAFDAVTVRHLLAQTSGIASYTLDSELMAERSKPTQPGRVLKTFTEKPLAFTPGSQFEYSNSNYFLLGLVIERASGLPYERYLQEKVLVPAGMTRTSTVDAPDAPNTAVGRTMDESDQVVETKPIDMSIPFAAGALRSTPHDLVMWDRALAAHSLLDTETETLRTTPVKSDYAFGVMRQNKHGHDVESHNGGIDGFSSHLSRVPDLGLVVVVLMNSDAFETDKLAGSVLRMALEGKAVAPPVERKVLPFDASVADAISGDYAIAPESKQALAKLLPAPVLESVLTTTVTNDGRKVTMKPNGQGAFTLYFGENNVLFTKKSGIAVTAQKDPTGKVTGISLEQGRLTIDYVHKP
jgi:CubicO group peptidase (beta-lactamase class C family)